MSVLRRIPAHTAVVLTLVIGAPPDSERACSAGLLDEAVWQPVLIDRPTPPQKLDFTAPRIVRGQYDEPLVTDRPDFTEASSTVGSGVVQLEMGYTFVNDAVDSAGEKVRGHSVPETLFRIGIANPVELRIFWNYNWEEVVAGASRDTFDGADDLGLGFKVDLFEGCACRPELAMLAEVSAPTGGSIFSNNKAEVLASFLYSWELPNEWSLAGSTGYSTGTDIGDAAILLADDRFNTYFQSVALGIPFTETVGMYVESFGLFSSGREDETREVFLNGGITYLVNNNVQLDIRFGVGLNDDSADFFSGAGGSFRF